MRVESDTFARCVLFEEPLGLVGEEYFSLRGRDRFGKIVTLHISTAPILQVFEMFFLLDTFCDNVKPKVLCK